MFSSASLYLLVGLARLAASLTSLSCHSQSQPNPIASEYPGDTTGTINGTYGIIIIPILIAREVIPSQYGIVTSAIAAHFPNLPPDRYPAFLEALQDHDVGSNDAGINVTVIPNFSRMALKYPFVDRLNDGYTSFTYSAPQLVGGNAIGILGSEAYGETLPANFDPPCDAYAAVSGSNDTTYLNGYAAPNSSQTGSTPDIGSIFRTVGSIPYSMETFINITNQPTFGNIAPLCDNYITLYNSSVTMGQYAPVPVQGNVSVVSPYYPETTTFTDVYGYRMDNAFIEKNFVPCEGLQGYAGTGPGDT